MAVLEKPRASSSQDATPSRKSKGIETLVVKSVELGARIASSRTVSQQANAAYSKAVLRDAKDISDYIIKKRTHTTVPQKKPA